MIKRFVFLLFCVFFALTTHADTKTINWYVDGQTYATTTCESGDDILLPTTPTKRGYNFIGWNIKKAKELEYIQFQKGSGSYIDTGIKFDSNEIEYETKLKFTAHNHIFAFGAAQSCSDGYTFQGLSGSVYERGSYSLAFFAVGGYVVYKDVNLTSINEYSLYINKSTNTIISSVNENVSSGILSGDVTTTKNIWLGKVNDTVCAFSGNIYYFKIKKDGVLVRDFIPAKDPDGVACMYDKVSKIFFYNQGSGLLGAGPEIQ